MMFVYRQPSIYTRLAEFSFYLFIAYILFGTSAPFPDTEGFNEENVSNIYNQIFFSLALLAGTVSLIPLRMEVLEIFRREKLLLILLGWCALTFIWSIYPFVGFKRIILLLSAVVTSLAILLHARGAPYILTRIKYVVGAYLLATLVAVIAIPAAIDPKFGTWRGLEPTKNNLGQVMLVCLLLLGIIRQSERGPTRQMTLMFTVLAGIILIGSWSITSVGVLLGLLGIAILVWGIDRAFYSEPIARILSSIILGGVALLLVGTLIWAPDLLIAIPQAIGKDITFSGRTLLWESMWEEIGRHWLLGTGYAGFWNPESIGMEILHEEFVWLPNQAHNGYLDVLNELGLVGVFLFGMLIVRYFVRASRLGEGFYWQWFIAAMLVMNLQESTFLRPHNACNGVFIFAYLMLFVEEYQRDLRRVGAEEKITTPN